MPSCYKIESMERIHGHKLRIASRLLRRTCSLPAAEPSLSPWQLPPCDRSIDSTTAPTGFRRTFSSDTSSFFFLFCGSCIIQTQFRKLSTKLNGLLGVPTLFFYPLFVANVAYSSCEGRTDEMDAGARHISRSQPHTSGRSPPVSIAKKIRDIFCGTGAHVP